MHELKIRLRAFEDAGCCYGSFRIFHRLTHSQKTILECKKSSEVVFKFTSQTALPSPVSTHDGQVMTFGTVLSSKTLVNDLRCEYSEQSGGPNFAHSIGWLPFTKRKCRIIYTNGETEKNCHHPITEARLFYLISGK